MLRPSSSLATGIAVSFAIGPSGELDFFSGPARSSSQPGAAWPSWRPAPSFGLLRFVRPRSGAQPKRTGTFSLFASLGRPMAIYKRNPPPGPRAPCQPADSPIKTMWILLLRLLSSLFCLLPRSELESFPISGKRPAIYIEPLFFCVYLGDSGREAAYHRDFTGI